MNRAAFYDSLRPHVNLTTQNVFGTEKMLDYAVARGTPLNRLAYILATAWWETAQTMTPVVEAYWMSEAWRRQNLRYYPWHGRGLVQTTWEDNYRKMSPEVGADLIKNPNLLLEWRYALPALFIGMEKGLYTGAGLDDHIDLIDEPDADDLREYMNARRVVNGTDKAATIANLALRFENALKAGGYAGAVPPVPVPKPSNVEDAAVGTGAAAGIGLAIWLAERGSALAIIAGLAAFGLVGWLIWKRRKSRKG